MDYMIVAQVLNIFMYIYREREREPYLEILQQHREPTEMMLLVLEGTQAGSHDFELGLPPGK